MRCFRVLRARQDIVELLVRQGRLADIQMLNFFSIQLDRETTAANRKAADASSAAAATTATTTATTATAAAPPAEKATKTAAGEAETPAKASAGESTTSTGPTVAATAEAEAAAKKAEDTAKAAAQKAAQLMQSREAKKKAWAAFHDRKDAVQQLATHDSPVAWLKEVYGSGEEWSSSFLSAAQATATVASPQEPLRLRANGVATVVGSGDAKSDAAGMPKSIRVVLRLEQQQGKGKEGGEAAASKVRGGAGPQYVIASVRLDQAGVVEKRFVHGMLRVRLADAEAVRNESLTAQQVASYQHVLTATAYSAILRRMEDICALHATNTVRYDALLIRNPAVQMRLSQLSCFRYGVDCLTDYVVGDPEVEEGEEREMSAYLSDMSSLLHMPLIESMALNIYAERALMDGIDGMWDMVRDTPLVKAVPHRSAPTKMIDYPYLKKILESSKYMLTASDGSMEEQALTFLGPLLSHAEALGGGSQSGGGLGNMMRGLAGLTAGHSYGGVRLAAPHINLSQMAKQLELDVAQLLNMIQTEKEKTEPTFVISAAQYISEVMANLAVIYRCTAALNIDEEGRGHREWLLTQAFGGASAVRRQRILDDYRMSRAAAKVLKKSQDLDNYSTHPVELMNAAHASAKAAAAAAAKGTPSDNKEQQ